MIAPAPATSAEDPSKLCDYTKRIERAPLLSRRRVDVLSHDFKESIILVRQKVIEKDPIALHDRYIKMFHAKLHGANTGVTGTTKELRDLKRQISELAPDVAWEWEPTYIPALYPPPVKKEESGIKKFAQATLKLLGIDLSNDPILPAGGSHQEIVEEFFKRYSSKALTADIALHPLPNQTYYCACTLSCERVVISAHQSSLFSIKEAAKEGKIETTVAKAYTNAHAYIERLLSQYGKREVT